MKLIQRRGRAPVRHPERAMQVALFQWAALQSGTLPELKLMFAIPNGGARPTRTNRHGQKFSPEAVRLRAEGVKPGVPDICLPVPRGGYHGLWIELKAGKNQASPAQRGWLEALTKQGYRVATIRDEWLEACSLIQLYLGGFLVKGEIAGVPMENGRVRREEI